MLYVSPIVEALRGRPLLVFWTATLSQAFLWILVPSLFYASPPGDVPLVLAIGHEWQLGSGWGPPLAFLLMVGISAFAAPTPDFGPAVVAMALTALALLFYWRAVGEGRAQFWLALGVVLGLLLLTTYFGVILLALVALFTAATERGRA